MWPSNTSCAWHIGVYGEDTIEGSTQNIGVYGKAKNGTSSYGIYGESTNAISDWAGYFVGYVYATGDFIPSDRKLKNDIKSFNNALTVIEKLKPAVYTYKTDEYNYMSLPTGIHYGLIADEVGEILPGLIRKANHPAQYENNDKKNGKKINDDVEFNAINYTELIPILIAGMKEQQKTIETLQSRIDFLEKASTK
jgi:hypothetical protein